MKEWEYALVEGNRKILHEPILVERTGGPAEKDHGTDILITLPWFTWEELRYCYPSEGLPWINE